MQTLYTIFMFLLAMIILIAVHEYGHYIIARLLNIKVLRFAIGFGKPIFSWRDKQGTEYALCRYPLGGYVRLLDEREAYVAKAQRPHAFNRQPLWKRCCVVLAGPGFNLIFAILALWLVLVIGVRVPVPFISEVLPDSIAARAGIQPQTKIIAVDQQAVNDWREVSIALLLRLGDKDTLQITTHNAQHAKQQTHSLNLQQWSLDPIHPNLLQSLGIKRDKIFTTIQYPLAQALPAAMQQTWLYLKLNTIMLGKLFIGKISLRSLGGPISLFLGSELALKQGLVIFIQFLALISIALAFVNLLPIPGLDGGHLLYFLLEKISGRPISVAMQILLFRLGMIVLFMLMIQILLNDLQRLT
jgi:regulator of sigma E protease